jgi:hypothetical protein
MILYESAPVPLFQLATWSRLRRVAAEDPGRIARVLADIGLPEIIGVYLRRKWDVEGLLLERYVASRRRPFGNLPLPRDFERSVQRALQRAGVPFTMHVPFSGKDDRAEFCDFAIPGKAHPKVVVVAKPFDAIEHEMEGFLRYVEAIAQAKHDGTYFFLVTDGIGWRRHLILQR